MSLRDRLNRLEELRGKDRPPRDLLDALLREREKNGNFEPIPPDLDLATVYSMLIKEMPN